MMAAVRARFNALRFPLPYLCFMLVEVRKPFLGYTKGQVIETTQEQADKWFKLRYAMPYVEPKPVSKLGDLVLPEKPVKEARALKKRIDTYYENKAKDQRGI